MTGLEEKIAYTTYVDMKVKFFCVNCRPKGRYETIFSNEVSNNWYDTTFCDKCGCSIREGLEAKQLKRQ